MRKMKAVMVIPGFFLCSAVLSNILGCSQKENVQNSDGLSSEQANISENSMKELIRSDPNNVIAYCGLGNIYIQNREFDKAIDIFQEAVKVDDANPEVYVGLGNAYSQKGDVEKSSQFLNKALALDGNNANAYFMLGLLYFNRPEFSAEMPGILEKLDSLDKGLSRRLRDIYSSTKR